MLMANVRPFYIVRRTCQQLRRSTKLNLPLALAAFFHSIKPFSQPWNDQTRTFTPLKMPLERSEYLSEVWRDGLFGRLFAFRPASLHYLGG